MEGPSDGEPSSFAACQEAYHTNDNRVGVLVGNNHRRIETSPARVAKRATDIVLVFFVRSGQTVLVPVRCCSLCQLGESRSPLIWSHLTSQTDRHSRPDRPRTARQARTQTGRHRPADSQPCQAEIPRYSRSATHAASRACTRGASSTASGRTASARRTTSGAPGRITTTAHGLANGRRHE